VRQQKGFVGDYVRHVLPDYTTTQISTLIDEHIHNSKYRDILRLRLIDGMTYEQIAEESDMSVRQTKNIVYKALQILIRYL